MRPDVGALEQGNRVTNILLKKIFGAENIGFNRRLLMRKHYTNTTPSTSRTAAVMPRFWPDTTAFQPTQPLTSKQLLAQLILADFQVSGNTGQNRVQRTNLQLAMTRDRNVMLSPSYIAN
jgi:hypothetical protein